MQNRYVVERQIGQGGMGAVFVATDQRFGSTVALKETFFDDPGLRKAFEREARLLNRLRHPALPRVSDHFAEAEGQFLVMEYIEGDDLSDMLKRRGRPFPARDVLAWADQLLDALEYLHAQEPAVVHRDIKPQNIKLLPRNQVVLLDFGLAKGSAQQTRVTATGSVFGYSFNYAPIEQMQGTGTDPRSDLYSLGATLYHLLTGAPPPDALTRATAVLSAQPDPLRPANEAAPEVPAAVAAVLTRSLALSAAQRYPSASEMRAAFGDAAREAGEGAKEAGRATPATQASEQATQLIHGAGRARTSPAAGSARETNVKDGEAATLLNAGDAGTASAPPNAAATPAEDSLVTRVATGVAAARPNARARRPSRVSVCVAAGVAVLAVVGALVYSLTRPGGSSNVNVDVSRPGFTEQAPPAATPVATQLQVEAAAPAGTAPTPAAEAMPALPARPRRTPDAREAGPGATPPQDVSAPPTPPSVPRHEQHPAGDAAPDPFDGRDLVNDPADEEEIRRLTARYPGLAHVIRKRVQQARRRANAERRRQGLPPLPPLRSPQTPDRP